MAQKAASKEQRDLAMGIINQEIGEDEDESDDEDEDDEQDEALRRKIAREIDEDEYENEPGILPVYGKNPVNPARAFDAKSKKILEAQDEEDDVPELIDSELPTIQAALDSADVVVEVLDARDPIGFRSSFLEDLVLIEQSADNFSKANKSWHDRLLIVLNKADLVPRETAQAWLAYLRKTLGPKVPVVLFKASFVETPIRPGMTVYGLKAGETEIKRVIPSGVPVGREALLSTLAALAHEKNKSSLASGSNKKAKKAAEEVDPLRVTFVGQPNVGKSAVINTLLGRPKIPTAPTIPSNASGTSGSTTKTPQEYVLNTSSANSTVETEMRLIDTPGWEFNPPDLEDDEEEDDDDMDQDEQATEDDAEKWRIMEETVARDMLTRNLGRVDKIKDPMPLGESDTPRPLYQTSRRAMLTFALFSPPNHHPSQLSRLDARLQHSSLHPWRC